MTDGPPDVGRRPPDVGGFQSETPVAHIMDTDLVTAVSVDDELRFGGGAGGREYVGRIVGLHYLVAGRSALAAGDELAPDQIAFGLQGRRGNRSRQDDDAFDRRVGVAKCVAGDRPEIDVASLAEGDVGG